MTFTDEDLKRLKEFRLQGYHTVTAFEQNEIVDLVDALLTRMEAAEAYCFHRWDHIVNVGGEKWEADFLNRWRKAAGK